jgi:hypothetical protein
VNHDGYPEIHKAKLELFFMINAATLKRVGFNWILSCLEGVCRVRTRVTGIRV